ncbi:GNAT family N-acetyltransferase [Halorussus sp. MSC15.2]|uniref:GNAT family N-acetyltransferase n=1 Tax=Halorussus sp. MSC15.2 TaxID=2283638 RepID=UPI0035C881FA
MGRADEQGNGYATDAARAVLDHGFDRLGLNKVTAERSPRTRRPLGCWRNWDSPRRVSSGKRRSSAASFET